MTDKFILPDRLREELRKPFGPIIEDPSELNSLNVEDRRIISIGDFVTIVLLDSGLRPFLSVVDSMVERIYRPDMKERIEKANGELSRIRVKNPAGTISEELWENLKEAIGGRSRVRLEVEGEEDLAALAAIYLSGPTDLVIYGQPKVGMVIVKPEEVRHKVKKILEMMT
jgi:hypothetical protein